jgi:hypothetical protein
VPVWVRLDVLHVAGVPPCSATTQPVDNVHVAKDLTKIKKGIKLSPVLVLRGDLVTGRPLTVADGYHRVCASCQVDEDANIPCRMGDPPTT